MIDTALKSLKVWRSDKAGPSLMLPYSQLDEVRRLLDEHQIRYWVDEQVISVDEEPFVAFVEFYRSENADQIQALLDSKG